MNNTDKKNSSANTQSLDAERAPGRSIVQLPSSPFGLIAVVGVVFLCISMATRCVLLLQSSPDVDTAASALGMVFASGLFYDAVAFSYFMVPLVLCISFAPKAVFVSRRWRLLLYGFIVFLCTLLIFTACAEYFFWQEFESRFDFVAVDYLVYQREVTDNIRESYPLGIILPAIGLAALLFFVGSKRFIDRCLQQPVPWRRRMAAGSVFLLLPLASAVCITGSSVTISPNRINNSLAMNGIYSFCEALYNQRLNYEERYATRDPLDVSRGLRCAVAPENHSFTNRAGPVPDISRIVEKRPGFEARYNVIIVVLESMGGKFLNALGSKNNLTPNLDTLARRGLFFSELYATGTRTVRGLEAIALSVPPTPPASILKRPNNGNLFTIGSPFTQRSYEVSFFYGGYSYFDNMKRFFGGNGFRIIDRADVSSNEVTFSNAWGVCDEDIYRRAVQEADASYQRGRKFFSLIMTTSNHRPFTYPGGKIDIPSGKGRAGAVKYADFAVGELIREASMRSWFDDTIFIFIADHCTRSGGKNAITLKNYHIPCIVYGPKIIPPGTVDHLASQIDVAPTLFDILNWQYTSNFIGRSALTACSGNSRAFVSNHLTLGYLKDDMLATLEPDGKAEVYQVDFILNSQKEIALRENIVEEAITYYQGASSMYENRL
jgi:phosphoglycerol transferase MdoB-like AlkP superfamily enzyme